MFALNTEPVIEGFGDEVVVVLGATLGYMVFICYQVYLSLLPEAVEGVLRDLVDTGATSTVLAPPVAESKPETGQGDAGRLTEPPEQEPEDNIEVPIRLKYLDDVTLTVGCTLSTKVGVFKSRHFSQELQDGKVVRLICYGKLLRDDQQSLKQCGINAENNIIHVQVSVPPAGPPQTALRDTAPSQASRLEANVAPLAYLVLGGMLALFWYAHFQYRELFTTSATTALIGISGLFCVFVFTPAEPLYFPNLAEREFRRS